MTAPGTAWIACRFLHDATLIFLWGSFGYLAVGVPKHLSGEIAERLRGISLAAIATVILTTVASLPVQTALIADGWVDAFNGKTVWSVLTLTGAGGAWIVQAIGSCALLVIVAFFHTRRGALLAFVSGLMLAGLALSGHAAMHGGLLGYLHPINDALHVLSAGAWLGALLPFLLIIGRLDIAGDHTEVVVALRRFSWLGHGAVALVLLSGIANTLLVLGKLPLDWRLPYQAKLLLKITAVMVMTMLAVINRYVFVPRLQAHRYSTVRALKFAAMCEICLGVFAIALVSVFGTEDPV
ncbi:MULTISPECIES: copper homeostasis membrane protein CopD [unclassified Sinorhizobium]|uniref:copper homeostasis membrane protein CopD n=1 Tax=unclassified Sinorhizobium TaxID=2613772 RepID=UPI003526B727